MIGVLTVLAALMSAAPSWAQERPPREFVEFRGTWIRDAPAGRGHIAGLPVAGTIVIRTTPTDISVIKDGAAPEVYPVDGRQVRVTDPRTGARLERRLRFTLVAETLALTAGQIRPEAGGPLQTGRRLTNIITDAYSVAGDALTIERQLSVLLEPPGHRVTLSNPMNNRQTLVYRRAPEAPSQP